VFEEIVESTRTGKVPYERYGRARVVGQKLQCRRASGMK